MRLTITGSVGRHVPKASTVAAATSQAVSHRWPASISSQPWPSTPKPSTAWLTAMPDTPPPRAVSTAPTVPEW